MTISEVVSYLRARYPTAEVTRHQFDCSKATYIDVRFETSIVTLECYRARWTGYAFTRGDGNYHRELGAGDAIRVLEAAVRELDRRIPDVAASVI